MGNFNCLKNDEKYINQITENYLDFNERASYTKLDQIAIDVAICIFDFKVIEKGIPSYYNHLISRIIALR